tara:strand:- start:137 stop:508 length:372 start_codon:yes stop_codon:yes gene_type:complete
MCLCESEYPKETAFVFLEDLSKIFCDKFNPDEIAREKAYSKFFSETFNPILKERMIYFNRNPEVPDSLRDLKKGVMNYKDNVMKANDILIERGEKINLVVKKADSLRQESGSYFSSVSIHIFF